MQIIPKLTSGVERVVGQFATTGRTTWTGNTLLSLREFEDGYLRGGYGWRQIPEWTVGQNGVWVDVHNMNVCFFTAGEIIVEQFHDTSSFDQRLIGLSREHGRAASLDARVI